jgi:two-component system, chemotaxis family, chemotaxis protein CheY
MRVASGHRTMTSTTGIVQASERRPPQGRPVLFVVDDDVATVSLLRELVLDSGWECRGFNRIGEVRHAMAEGPPALLLLDDDLPDGRGGDLARDLRDDPAFAGVPLVVCTAAHPMRQAQIGAWAPVISKPFDLSTIERLLEAARPRPGFRSRGQRAG